MRLNKHKKKLSRHYSSTMKFSEVIIRTKYFRGQKRYLQILVRHMRAPINKWGVFEIFSLKRKRIYLRYGNYDTVLSSGFRYT